MTLLKRPVWVAVAATVLAFSCARGVSQGEDDDSGPSSSSGGDGGSTGATSTSGTGGSGTGGSGATAGSTSSGGAGGAPIGGGGSGGSGGSVASGGAVAVGGAGGTGPVCGNGILPLSEGFEGSVPPTGWSHVDGANTFEAWKSSTTSFSGASAAFHNNDWDYTDNDFVVMPTIDLSACLPGTTITLTFQEMVAQQTWYQGHYVVYTTNPTPTSPGDFIQLAEMGATSLSWTQRTVSLDSLVGQPIVRIAFRYYGNDADNWFIDDVAIQYN